MLPLVNGNVTSFWRFVRLRIGVLVTSTQFAVAKSKFCCNTKLVEGITQESKRLVSAGAIFIAGAGVDCNVKIPPKEELTTSLLPFADEATEV